MRRVQWREWNMKKYLTMTKSEWALIIKLMLCTVLATVFSWAMGDVHNPTTAVTANLCLYVDRGYRGTLIYAARRITAQVIQGALVLLVILPCKYFNLPIPDGALIVVACCLAIGVGLPLNYKHTYAPLNCTLANATFIIACAAVQSMEIFPRRVLQCVAGALIGYFVNYIVFPYQDRGKEILRLADSCINALIQKRDFAAFNRNMALLEKEYGFVIADKGKKRGKSRMTREEIEFLRWNKETLQKLSAFVSVYELYKDQITDACKNLMWELLPSALTAHRQLIAQRWQGVPEEELAAVPAFKAECPEDLALLSRLLEYVDSIGRYREWSLNESSSVTGALP